MEVTREVAMDMKEAYESGTPQGEIAKKWSAKGFLTKTGKTLNQSAVSVIIRKKAKRKYTKKVSGVRTAPTTYSFVESTLTSSLLSRDQKLRVLAALID